MKLSNLTLGVGLTGIRLGRKTKQGILASVPPSIDFTRQTLEAVCALIYHTGKDEKELIFIREYPTGKKIKFTLNLKIEELKKNKSKNRKVGKK